MNFEGFLTLFKRVRLWVFIHDLLAMACGALVDGGCFHHAVGVADPSIISDNQMTASSFYSSQWRPHYGRLNDTRGDGWSAKQAKNPSDWLQVDFERTVEVCAVETQGDVDGNEWVIDFYLSFSSDGQSWIAYTYENGTQLVFTRQGDNYFIDQQTLPVTMFARYIRFHPISQNFWNNFRVEVYEEINECTTNKHNCHAHANCSNSVGSFDCSCNTGFSGDGRNCSDIDECSTNTHNCDLNARCADTDGSFSCTCNQGYSGNGTFCSDIDECSMKTHNCDLKATCADTDGSFSCTCNQGYSGNGTFCSDIDECSTNAHNCDLNATCADTDGSFSCACNLGFSGNGTYCSDIYECTTNSHNCDPLLATCNNSVGSFVCECIQGYSGDGITCLDIDECSASTHNCHGVAHCYNSEGSFTCSCRTGYTGDGLTCDPLGDFSVSIRNISKDRYQATPVKRSIKSVKGALIEGFPQGVTVLQSVLEWRLVSEAELAASESAEGTLVSHGTAEWIIGKRSVRAGVYQIKFKALIKIGDPGAPATLQAFDYGFIESIAGPVRAIIDGGSSVRWGSTENVTVDGSLSYDGDIGPGNHIGLNFTWSCSDLADNISMDSNCFGAFANENANATAISIDTTKLTVGKKYILRLTVTKDKRSAFAEMIYEVAAGEIPQVTLRCFVDCGAVVSASNKLRVTSECLNSACNGSLYEWSLTKLNAETNTWENVSILPNMTSTGVTANNMIVKKNSLPSGLKFSLMLVVKSAAGSEGFGVLEFETAGAPHSGYCSPSSTEGVALETEFTFECFEWQDKNTPLTYEFRAGKNPISYGNSPKSALTVLPAGEKGDDYQLPINVIIKNPVGVAVVITLFVKVKGSSKLDPCATPADEVGNELKSFVVGEGNKMDGFLNKGEVSQAAQLAMSVLKAANAKSECGKELSIIVKTAISVTITEKFTSIQPESPEMSRTIMAVISEAGGVHEGGGGGGAGGGGAKAVDLVLKMSQTATKELVNALNDPEEPLTPEVEEAAVGVAGVLKNVLKSSSGIHQAVDSASSKANVDKAAQNLNDMSDAFLGRLVSSESMVIKTNDLAVALKKVSPEDVRGLSMEEGPSKFKLPVNLGNMGGGNVNAKMTAVNFNPYTWDNSSKAIQSSVTSLELKNGKAIINVSNLEEDIVMVIPISSKPKSSVNSTEETEHLFMRPNKMSVHSYYAEIADVPVNIEASVQEANFLAEIFVKFGSRPTIDNFHHNFTISFKHTCKISEEDNGTFCLFEKRSVTVMPTKASRLYVGIIGSRNFTEHARNRRSCFGHGRQKRACVGFKDPPPRGVTTNVVPQYDPSTDVNYTMTITQSSCLYWSEDNDKWTSDGCKVDRKSNSTHLVCRCNHLTSFGGSFVQAPNPIDFDKVFAEFGNLAESGNISVLITICCAFLLYFVVLVFARRADKRDEHKMCLPKQVTIDKDGTYYYDMVIASGVWKNSGTTANVTISIKGEINDFIQVPLRSKGEGCELFGRGSIDGFVVIASESLGPIKEITLEHDNAGENPCWFVETVTIRDRQSEEQWSFQINRWLAVDKEDGLIEVTANNSSSSTFSSEVRSRFGRKIADSHLWMSVFGKACSSTFTRVQRASCCLSVLFSAMIANAMFYNIGGESEGAIQVGPFKFSLRQIIVGVQSGLIVAPVNVFIAFLFKLSKPRSKKGDKYKQTDHTQKLVDQVSGTGCMLPHFCVYIAWIFCLSTSLTAATFTLFYSLTWGKEVAEQWLSSILISNGQDIFVVQPTKVILAVLIVSLLLTRTRKKIPSGEKDAEQGGVCEDDIDFLIDNPKEKFKRSRLELIRERTKKEVKLANMTKEIVVHLIFVFFLAVVCYGNKNNYRFMMTSTLLSPFAEFDAVTDRNKLWGWMRQEFLPNIYSQPWYNGLKEKEDVFIENKMSMLIGMPWIRQLRIKKSSCEALSGLISDCYYDYTSNREDTTPLSLPGWRPLPHNTSWPKALSLCPKPWRYQTSDELDNDPITGSYHSYEGGGYVAVMGYDEGTAQGVLGETLGHGWLDRHTRAVMLEFAVFNANTNLLSIATYFYEVLATGAAYTARRVNTLELYSTESGALLFYLACQFLFMAMVLYHLIMMFVHLYRQRLKFFISVWNMVDFLMIIFSVLSVACYMIRSKSVLKSVKAIQDNPYEILHFHEALDWANWENVSIAVAIFMVTVKLLNSIRFNPYVIYLFSSFRQSIGYQLSYVIFFLILFNAFVVSGKQFFGGIVLEYSGYMQAVISQFEFLLGRAVPLDDLRREKPFLGPIFAFTYNITMSIVLMNMLVSVLNESYTDARTQAEESAQELEMARFIGDRLIGVFQKGRMRNDFKLYCDESTFANMCRSDAEPFCLNSASIIQCTEERMIKLEKRVAVLARRTDNIETDYGREEDEFENLFLAFVHH